MSEILIENERSKLLANALDRASTACVSIGVIAPIAAFLYGAPGTLLNPWSFAIGAIIWIFGAVVLHMVARYVLGGMRQ